MNDWLAFRGALDRRQDRRIGGPTAGIRLQIIERDLGAVLPFERDLCTVTLLTATGCRGHSVHGRDVTPPSGRSVRIEVAAMSFHRLGQVVVERGQDVSRCRVMTAGELLELTRVTARAVFGRHDRCNHRAFMIEGIGICAIGFVTVQTADSLLRVGAVAPVLDDVRSLFGVTLDAALGALRNHHMCGGAIASFLFFAQHFHVLHEEERAQEGKP